MLTGGPNYIMIRKAIFAKVHGHGVKGIFPPNMRAWPVAPKWCSLAPGWLDSWDTEL